MPVIDGFDVLRELKGAPVPPRVRTALHARLRAEALALAETEDLVQAAASWEIVPLDVPLTRDGEAARRGVLCVEGESLAAPWLIPQSGRLTAVACGVGTLGPKFEARASSLFAEKKRALAVAMDDLGNELLFAVSRRLQDRLHAAVRRAGLTMAGELRAGDPGLALDAQRLVMRLAGADAIGVSLTSACMMRPVKSTSMVLGVGLALPAARWSRCDGCRSRERCTVAREAEAERA